MSPEAKNAAETLRTHLGRISEWYPLFEMLGEYLEGRSERPVALRDPNNNLWRLYRNSKVSNPVFMPPPPPIRSLPSACVYPPAGTYPIPREG